MLSRAALLLALLPLSGCFLTRDATNAPLNPAQVATLEPGTSTANDVLAALGAPSEVIQLGRRSAWRYDHTVNKRTALFLVVLGFMSADTQQDRVWVFFDEADRLAHIGSTLTAETAKYAPPWDDSHE